MLSCQDPLAFSNFIQSIKRIECIDECIDLDFWQRSTMDPPSVCGSCNPYTVDRSQRIRSDVCIRWDHFLVSYRANEPTIIPIPNCTPYLSFCVSFGSKQTQNKRLFHLVVHRKRCRTDTDGSTNGTYALFDNFPLLKNHASPSFCLFIGDTTGPIHDILFACCTERFPRQKLPRNFRGSET